MCNDPSLQLNKESSQRPAGLFLEVLIYFEISAIHSRSECLPEMKS
ncbi:hypothetical protein J8TS2_37650 [Lederbergia ruris]|uniref:Uncharacterized protein n=1 Tax=Lederbergia ruris TaxID=217495 RepID=A0ABQ4KPM2_9BACI|nr:hypothetical protein J8TS2_37650 [Lederbergia ruris]